MSLQADKLPISHNNVVGENTVLQLNILETSVLIRVGQNSYPTRRMSGSEFISNETNEWVRIHLQ